MMKSGPDLLKEGTRYTTELSSLSVVTIEFLAISLSKIEGCYYVFELCHQFPLHLHSVTLHVIQLPFIDNLNFLLKCLSHCVTLKQPVCGAVRTEYFTVTLGKLDPSG